MFLRRLSYSCSLFDDESERVTFRTRAVCGSSRFLFGIGTFTSSTIELLVARLDDDDIFSSEGVPFVTKGSIVFLKCPV